MAFPRPSQASGHIDFEHDDRSPLPQVHVPYAHAAKVLDSLRSLSGDSRYALEYLRAFTQLIARDPAEAARKARIEEILSRY
jgi:hypothetical protein